MKTTITFTLTLFIATLAHSQDKWYRLEKRDLAASATMFAAGSMEGTAETLKWHYDQFESVFRDANSEYWNPKVSWRNKYKNQDPTQGPAYFGSTTFLAWTTDAYHLMRTGRNLMFATTLFIMPKCEFDWRRMLLRVAVYTLSYQAGFHLTYTVIFE